ncbi:MAG: heme-copper oxidase subunit III [Verrucomicrobiaceae bacterium]|nr:heme-copper oxidase subunit III [Verrucomicrobiaceae bacterium]
MVNKYKEYSAKLAHYSVTLTDGSILSGHLEHGYHITFGDVKELNLNIPVKQTAVKADPVSYVIPFIDGTVPAFKTAEGTDVTLDAAGFAQLRADAIAKAKAEKRDSTVVKLTASAPIKFVFGKSDVFTYTADSAVFRDGTSVTGKLIDDKITLTADALDLRSVPAANRENSLAFDARYLGEAWKKFYIQNRDKEIHAFNEEYSDGKGGTTRDPAKSATFQKHAFGLHIESQTPPAGPSEHGGAETDAHAAAADSHGAGHGGHGAKVVIETKDVSFFSNYTPKLNTYYAIYFTLTGLHGLHVIGGALVLLYFLVFNGKMMREDTEHFANRVEVGGLFWHFVDLIWIFLFPLLYLL